MKGQTIMSMGGKLTLLQMKRSSAASPWLRQKGSDLHLLQTGDKMRKSKVRQSWSAKIGN